jgi:hypothetical protein
MKTLATAFLSALTLISGAALADSNDGKAPGGGTVNGRALPILLYRAAGARELTGSMATSVSCSNFTGSLQQVQIILRNYNFAGTNAYSVTQTILANGNRAYSTEDTNWLSEDDTGSGANALNEGSLIIRGTTTNIHCSAWISDVTAATSAGATPLHLVRFNPVANSQE